MTLILVSRSATLNSPSHFIQNTKQKIRTKTLVFIPKFLSIYQKKFTSLYLNPTNHIQVVPIKMNISVEDN